MDILLQEWKTLRGALSLSQADLGSVEHSYNCGNCNFYTLICHMLATWVGRTGFATISELRRRLVDIRLIGVAGNEQVLPINHNGLMAIVL